MRAGSDWTDPAFRAAALEWIESHVEVAAEIEQRHVQPWSTVFRVPTGDGNLWFKAVGDSFEVPLTARLGLLYPGRVPDLVASDAARGWMLMDDGGVVLRELLRGPGDLWRWEEYLPQYGSLQIAAANLTAEFVEMGVPREQLADLAGRIAGLIDDLGGQGLAPAELAQLESAVPEIAKMSQDLAAVGIPETIQHDDLNDGNVYMQDGAYRTLDWGDACISHPFHSLTVLLRSTAFRLDLAPGGVELNRVRDAYLEPFHRYAERAELRQAADLAYQTGTLARALAWHRYVASLPSPERREEGESVLYGLRKFLERGPIGSWR